MDAILTGADLPGANTRHINGPLAPLQRDPPLSAGAVAWIVGRLTSHLEAWRRRSLLNERLGVLYHDAITLPVWSAPKVESP